MPLRRAALAAATALTALLAGAPTAAADRVAVRQIDRDLLAAAFTGDGAVVALRSGDIGAVVQRRVAGRRPQILLRDGEAGQVRLAASPQAVAVSVWAGDEEDRSGSRVLVGPPGGPLREVARCAAALFAPPVAVEGTRLSWSEGSCLSPEGRPQDLEPGAIALADVDPAVPVRRVAVPEERLPVSLTLGGEPAAAGFLRPSLLAFFGGELRRIAGDTLGPAVAGGAGVLLAPVGVAPGGEAIAVRSRNDFPLEPEGDSVRCELDLVAVGDAGARHLPAGGCLSDSIDDGNDDGLGSADAVAVVTGGRIAVRVRPRRVRGEDGVRFRAEDENLDERTPATVQALGTDGRGRRALARGGAFRPPLGLVGGSGRLGWAQQRCIGGTQIREVDPLAMGATARIRPCDARLLTRRARLRRGAVRLRLRCPRGCKGRVVDTSVCSGERSATFRFGRGVHTVRLPLTRRSRRLGHAVLRVRVEAGRDRGRTIRVRRR